MKLFLIKVCICLISISCCAQNKFSLTVITPQEFNGQRIDLLIKDINIRNTEQILTGTLKNNLLTFKGNINSPAKHAFLEVAKGPNKYKVQFVLDTGVNQISLGVKNEQYRVLQLLGNRSLANRIKDQLDSLFFVAHAVNRQKNNLTGPSELSKQMSHQLDLDQLAVIQKYPTNYAALMQLYFLYKNISMRNYGSLIINTLRTFESDLQSSEIGLNITDRYELMVSAESASRVGQKIIDFEVVNELDSTVLSSKLLMNKPYILAFSATWCIPCREHLPKLKSMYNKFADKGLKVIYYNQDDNHKEWNSFIRNENLNWINISEKRDKNSLSVRLNVQYVPTYFIIDKSGTIIYNSDRMDPDLKQLETYIRNAL